ncbi:hypothetical protein INR77_10890 [Erythrobacter sp. SCSIO 43205]|uniref:M56 family metallopeptidase n=1 Tax=Erythrobacter sp. SCSIO 43205 TaxID=2779361 RepID=UPI001CA8C7B7|nr:M56 family metallopeptidase [Erythrobacter sp. SCSIO 43205]UAB77314.1 hypothetical protein INR77_10890 [Erythrobacter sp. SCSIO 43205]
MTHWMIETLLWTAVLIAFVLLVRRPVARHFGPQIAYALWALPALRLFLPPIELPAWMQVSEPAASQVSEPLAQAPIKTLQPSALAEEAALSPVRAEELANPIVGQVLAFDFSQLVGPALGLWLVGAGLFLVLRFSAYFRLRSELLDGAREMGRCGKVRLIETPGTNAPLAFGVIDKVIALPQGFLAQPDRALRDLALEHELEHHRGRDLLVNILVQPLFAIHWWNPLGRYGWLALRRDQEAACDARVMANAKRGTREIYANLIVSFAAGSARSPAHALTAPMACPVLGEKSIIHRLRSLKMENTNRKQRLAGRALLGAGVIALPLTASISYAASEPSQGAQTQSAPQELVQEFVVNEQMATIDPDAAIDGGTHEERVFVVKNDEDSEEKNVRVIVKREMADAPDGEGQVKREMRIRRSIETDADGKLSEEQIEEIMTGVRAGLEEANRVLEDLPQIIETAMAEVEVEMDREGHAKVRVESSCDGSDSEVATTSELGDGTRVVKICQKRVMATALEGLKEAREDIKNDTGLSKQARKAALREIDRAIDRWSDNAR